MKNVSKLGVLALLVLSLVFPLLFPNPAVTSIAVFALIFAGAATGWNIFSGYTGYVSLGHAAFYGLGAYAFTMMCHAWNIPGGIPPFLLLPLAGLVTGICSLPLGWVALKTRRFTFVVITIAIFVVSAQLPNLFSGSTTSLSEVSLPIPTWSGDIYNLPFYYAALILLLLAFGTSWWIRHSKYGLGLLAIRDDESRTQGLGVKVGLHKLVAFVISAIFVGMAGAINAYFIGFISPTSAFDRSVNIAIPLMAFLGGSGTLFGPIIGTVLAVPLQQYLTLQYGAEGWDLILYGVLFLLIVLVLPEGILPALLRRWSKRIYPRDKMMKTIEAPLFLNNNVPLAASLPVVPPDSAPPVSQATLAHSVTSVQLPEQINWSIPRRRVELPESKGLTQKVRAQRLVSIPQDSSATTRGAINVPPANLLCPRCNGPLYIWGATRFCTQCGLTLSLLRRVQSSSTPTTHQKGHRPNEY